MLVIVNNVAAKARQSWPKIKFQLDAEGVDYKTHFTNKKGDATFQTSVALKSGIQLIVVVGGVIPPQDYPELYAAGAKAIFGPGTSIADAAIDLLQKLGAKADAKSQQAAE